MHSRGKGHVWAGAAGACVLAGVWGGHCLTEAKAWADPCGLQEAQIREPGKGSGMPSASFTHPVPRPI